VSVEHGIITAVMPPGGWHYQQKLSSGDTVKLDAFSFEAILETMLDFRRRHPDLCFGAENASIEAVRRDLKEYLCAHFKQNCADSPGAASYGAIGVTPTYKAPIDRAGNWLAQLANTRPERIDYALAGTRAQVCTQCPFNIKWQTGCQACNDNIAIKIQHANGSLSTPYDRRLLTCRAYGWVNAVAIWLSDPVAEAEHEPPAHCWVKR
jgi:hypothetical protein